ncbi:hypothetical protein SAMN02910292_02846 [Lachnospiraceae bacterium XBB2008]|nr:hypothetical protein SAMN02910292_02846 [Lachnospiraceae bacterium XBB2008]
MYGICRVIDQFRTTKLGWVLVVHLENVTDDFHEGDILYDLDENRFRIKSIGTMMMLMSDVDEKYRQNYGFIIEALDSEMLHGTILVKEPAPINFIFCNHPLYRRTVDEDYEEEYECAKVRSGCALFSYEDMEEGKLSLYGDEISGLTIYRGWMMKPEMYRKFYELVAERGIILINSPDEYERYHLLPGWYEEFKRETAESVWTKGNDLQDVIGISKELNGPYIVKDYVKSRKHEWYDACYIEDASKKDELVKIVGNFIDRQDDDLVGGVVLRQFVELNGIGNHEKSGMPLSEEYRVFILGGRILVMDDYWRKNGETSFTDKEYKWIEQIASRVRSNFVTVDIARKTDGSLIIMEFGDGQVSGLQQIKPEIMYGALTSRCRVEL